MRKSFQAWNIILVAIFAILLFAVLYPILYIFKASFVNPETGAFSLKSYITFLHYPYYLRCLGNSLFVSTLSTFLALAIGIPFAFFLSRYRIPGKNLIRTLGTLPLILPTFIGAEAWLILPGRNGLFAKIFQGLGMEMPSIYGWKGIVLVFTLQFFPFVFLMVSAALNAIDRSLEEAATNLGAGKLRVFFTVTLPVITPAILSGALVVFYLCIENFGVPVLIGEDFRVLSVQAYSEFISELGGNPAMAGALSMILLAITLGLTIFQKYWVERKNYTMTSLNPIQVKRLRPLPTFLIWLFCAGVVSVAIFPFAVVAELSATIVLYYGPWATMTVEIFQRIGSGDFGPASVYATILILSVLIPLFILNRVSGRNLASSL